MNKRTYNYTKKLSKNYNSVSVSEGFELEDCTPEEFEQAKKELKQRVIAEAEQAINQKEQVTIPEVEQ